MSDHFLISGPAVISFSGGRTSGYMLWRILQAHGGKLPDDVRVVFANTGKEMEETLEFVQAASDHWRVPITWVEYRPKIDGKNSMQLSILPAPVAKVSLSRPLFRKKITCRIPSRDFARQS